MTTQAATMEPAGGAEDKRRKLTGKAIKTFVMAGHARFTLVSLRTGTRFTYEVVAADDEADSRMFVRVLTGADNEGDYTYLGTIFDRSRYAHGRRSRIGQDAPSAVAFAWAWPRLCVGVDLMNCEIWHEGRCGRCGRVLTVPESIDSGIGPVCAEKGL